MADSLIQFMRENVKGRERARVRGGDRQTDRQMGRA